MTSQLTKLDKTILVRTVESSGGISAEYDMHAICIIKFDQPHYYKETKHHQFLGLFFLYKIDLNRQQRTNSGQQRGTLQIEAICTEQWEKIVFFECVIRITYPNDCKCLLGACTNPEVYLRTTSYRSGSSSSDWYRRYEKIINS